MSDLELLQGAWRQVSGEANVADEYGDGLTTVFEGHRFTVRRDDGSVVLEGDFVMDESMKSIDWIDSIGPDAGKVLPAIYRLDRDQFSFVAADEGMPRPRVFRAGPGEVMRTFERS